LRRPRAGPRFVLGGRGRGRS